MSSERSDECGSKLCERCKCCEASWRPCDYCGADGVYGHDCGEDCCCCLEPEDNVECQWCEGEGGWWWCGCDEKGIHAPRVEEVTNNSADGGAKEQG